MRLNVTHDHQPGVRGYKLGGNEKPPHPRSSASGLSRTAARRGLSPSCCGRRGPRGHVQTFDCSADSGGIRPRRVGATTPLRSFSAPPVRRQQSRKIPAGPARWRGPRPAILLLAWRRFPPAQSCSSKRSGSHSMATCRSTFPCGSVPSHRIRLLGSQRETDSLLCNSHSAQNPSVPVKKLAGIAVVSRELANRAPPKT